MATFANKFSVYAYGDLVRLVFEDCITGTEGIIQAQIVMRTPDAEALSTTITKTVEQLNQTRKPEK